MSLTLWLSPDDSAARWIAAQIASLAKSHGTPPFEPHVTLLRGIELPAEQAMSLAEELSVELWPMAVTPKGFGDSDEIYRSVYLELDLDADLVSTRRRADETFGMEGARFEPHVSMIYGSIARVERKRIADDLAGLTFPPITLTSLALVDTTGDAPAWKVLGRFPFHE